ncbi:hypothetical protein ONS95_003215 [Cadophora gregata]|uniref:uncharacterized protein n=1 Tax=Cadophora gregata TaxID=51156 RepID=UPI0026DAFFCF|nr:uncharacterized protein ONS95_003215 [Cadophora gregata]KAK0108407.1 hypothetical protein ONS95_003215 [Cadophora gregata]KAK0108999.1 hypothetical protein ONS96_002836 [Cadophora gregata f. sp. sojae]
MACNISEGLPEEVITSSADRKEPVSIEALPNEILSQVFGYLDTSPPSHGIDALHDEPDFDITRSEDSPLKACSLASKRWRDVSKSILFKNAQFIVRQNTTRSIMLSQQMKPFFDFVLANSLRHINSFSLIVYDSRVTDNAKSERRLDDFADFWSLLFRMIDPVSFLIVAPPEALGALTSCRVILTDAWNFDCPCHYLRLQRPLGPSHDKASGPIGGSVESLSSPKDPPVKDLQQSAHVTSTNLFGIRPWDRLLLNEGSFIKAYATYEFWLRKAPSILQDLFGASAQNDKAHISPTICDMEYIALFPMCGHFADLSENLPRLDRLYCQLVPRNQILSDPKKMVQVESEDLWMERNASYASLMRELFTSPPSHNYQHLKVFESGDAADRAAWAMAVEYVKRAGNGWMVGGDGIFVRKPEDVKPLDGETEVEPSTFHGSLIRWAWNGTAELPVSAYPLYDHPMGP